MFTKGEEKSACIKTILQWTFEKVIKAQLQNMQSGTIF